jgi:ABC-type multidrug transport system fused ATPase/permease subunit
MSASENNDTAIEISSASFKWQTVKKEENTTIVNPKDSKETSGKKKGFWKKNNDEEKEKSPTVSFEDSEEADKSDPIPPFIQDLNLTIKKNSLTCIVGRVGKDIRITSYPNSF